ncbi:MAG: RpiB/LacA/LacB family sugar-phosphate isomerase [Actinomycetota bacterium]|nr:RpiB/LacA/LacB family sugar-phosphate isomerase [Actinomycetota bacterium]
MKIAIAADHAGYPLKVAVVQWLSEAGHEVLDLGTHSEEPVDYPPLCAEAGTAVVEGQAEVGIVIGGSGQGEAIAANKVHGVRAARRAARGAHQTDRDIEREQCERGRR